MSKSQTCLISLWLLLAGVFAGYILIPVLAPGVVGTPAFWLITMATTGLFLLILLILLYNIKRGPKTK
jgi:hypothetical protein